MADAECEENSSDEKYFISSWPPESAANSQGSPCKRTKYDQDKDSVTKRVYIDNSSKNNQVDTGDGRSKSELVRKPDECDTQFNLNKTNDSKDCMSWAMPALAKWWKERQKSSDIFREWKIPDSNNPRTILHHVSRYTFIFSNIELVPEKNLECSFVI